jgi:hypothetical protein
MHSIKFAIALLAAGGVLAAADPAIGTWKLNTGKTKYSPGPPPKSGTVTYEAADGGIKRSGEIVNADGQTVSFSYSANYDGKDYPMTGNPNADTISLKRVNDYAIDATLKKNGKTVSTARRVVSKDGKTLTITLTGTTPEGMPMKNTLVYDKQ